MILISLKKMKRKRNTPSIQNKPTSDGSSGSSFTANEKVQVRSIKVIILILLEMRV